MESDDECPPDLVPAQDMPESLTSEGEAQEPTRESSEPVPTAGAVPVTIVTGFLGAGKTTLLNYILTQEHGRRIAVIENEVGDSMDIEALIARNGADGSMLADNLFELKNGCICCTVKDDLVTTLETLLERRNKFDYVIIETTGLANPGPVASVFWLDDALESALRLDGIVTLVDAKNIQRQLQRVSDENKDVGHPGERPQNEAAMQVAYADRILINKVDLVSPDTLDTVVAQIRGINAVAEVRCTRRSTVDLDWVLDTKCFSPELALSVDPGLAPAHASPVTSGKDEGTSNSAGSGGGLGNSGSSREENGGTAGGEGRRSKGVHGGDSGSGHAHGDGGDKSHAENCAECAATSKEEGPGGKACSVHDPTVTTCAIDLPGSLELALLERWLGGLLWEPPPGGTEMYRVKGVVSVKDRDERFVVQGVADSFEVTPAGVLGSAWREGEARRCKIVFIGRLLSRKELEHGVRSCIS